MRSYGHLDHERGSFEHGQYPHGYGPFRHGHETFGCGPGLFGNQGDFGLRRPRHENGSGDCCFSRDPPAWNAEGGPRFGPLGQPLNMEGGPRSNHIHRRPGFQCNRSRSVERRLYFGCHNVENCCERPRERKSCSDKGPGVSHERDHHGGARGLYRTDRRPYKGRCPRHCDENPCGTRGYSARLDPELHGYYRWHASQFGPPGSFGRGSRHFGPSRFGTCCPGSNDRHMRDTEGESGNETECRGMNRRNHNGDKDDNHDTIFVQRIVVKKSPRCYSV